MAGTKKEIRPQTGFQEEFLSTPADIAIGGGGAGVGKTYAEILESIRHYNNPNSATLFFRRTYNQIMAPGGLWDEASNIYPKYKAKSSDNTWYFPSGAKVVFSHMQHEKNVQDWQGAQIPLIIFDELTHFTKRMFTYMLSRNRSATAGFTPYMRATCNPDADSFVRDLIDWWIDEDGYIIPERSGKLRYMTVFNDDVIWGDTKQEVLNNAYHLRDIENPLELIKSFTFIEGDISENKILLKSDPTYLANLYALSDEDQLRLLKRNWNVKLDNACIINYIKFRDVFSNTFVPTGPRRITADIATSGSDIFCIWVWEGKRAIDLVLIGKNNGKEAIQAIIGLKNKYNVLNSNILFDADGIGGGLTGFIDGAIEFHGGGSVFGVENYRNLRAQCYFNFSYCINQTMKKEPKDTYFISPEIKNRIYQFDEPKAYKGKTIEWILYNQIKAIKQYKPDGELKISIIPKEEMKEILQGVSPDLLDGMMMNERFGLISQKVRKPINKNRLGIR